MGSNLGNLVSLNMDHQQLNNLQLHSNNAITNGNNLSHIIQINHLPMQQTHQNQLNHQQQQQQQHQQQQQQQQQQNLNSMSQFDSLVASLNSSNSLNLTQMQQQMNSLNSLNSQQLGNVQLSNGQIKLDPNGAYHRQNTSDGIFI